MTLNDGENSAVDHHYCSHDYSLVNDGEQRSTMTKQKALCRNFSSNKSSHKASAQRSTCVRSFCCGGTRSGAFAAVRFAQEARSVLLGSPWPMAHATVHVPGRRRGTSRPHRWLCPWCTAITGWFPYDQLRGWWGVPKTWTPKCPSARG